MATLTSNSSDAFLQNLTHLRNQRDNTPTNSSNSGKNEEIVLLEKQGRSSQKLRSNLAQVSSTIGHNMNDISNICHSSGSTKVSWPATLVNVRHPTKSQLHSNQLPKIVLPPRKDRQSSAPPSALPRPPRTLKPPRKIEYGRLSETDSNKSNSKCEYEMKTSSLKRNQSPVTSAGSKNFVDIKSELQMALNPTKANSKSYGTIKSDTANNITKIYYSNKPDYLSKQTYQRLPESPSSSDSMKRFGGSSGSGNGKKITFTRSSPGHQQQSREGSLSSGSNSRSSPKPQEVSYQPLARSRTKTPPKYLNLQHAMPGSKMNYLSNSNNSSPTKPTLPSSSVLYHQAQSANPDWKQQHQRASSGRSNGSSGENKYRIQFWNLFLYLSLPFHAWILLFFLWRREPMTEQNKRKKRKWFPPSRVVPITSIVQHGEIKSCRWRVVSLSAGLAREQKQKSRQRLSHRPTPKEKWHEIPLKSSPPINVAGIVKLRDAASEREKISSHSKPKLCAKRASKRRQSVSRFFFLFLFDIERRRGEASCTLRGRKEKESIKVLLHPSKRKPIKVSCHPDAMANLRSLSKGETFGWMLTVENALSSRPTLLQFPRFSNCT